MLTGIESARVRVGVRDEGSARAQKQKREDGVFCVAAGGVDVSLLLPGPPSAGGVLEGGSICFLSITVTLNTTGCLNM